MPPTTLHGVEIITTLYFVIFTAFKESMTLNLAHTFWPQWKARVAYYFIRAVLVTLALSSTISEILTVL